MGTQGKEVGVVVVTHLPGLAPPQKKYCENSPNPSWNHVRPHPKTVIQTLGKWQVQAPETKVGVIVVWPTYLQ